MTPSIDIVLDGAARSVEEGTTGTSLFASERDVVAMRVDGEPWDVPVHPLIYRALRRARRARHFVRDRLGV